MYDVKREPVAFVKKQFKNADSGWEDPEEEEDLLDVKGFAHEPAEVYVEYGVTLNLQNFESARLTVGVRMPCYKEEVNDAYEYAAKWVEDRVQGEVASIRESRAKGR